MREGGGVRESDTQVADCLLVSGSSNRKQKEKHEEQHVRRSRSSKA